MAALEMNAELAARKDANNKLAEQTRRATELKKEYKAASRAALYSFSEARPA